MPIKSDKCKPYQIFNPKTGRCVKRTGKIGLALLKPMSFTNKHYIVLSETRHDGWTAWITTLASAKKLLKDETEVYYIFHTKNELSQMKLKYPLSDDYESLSINEFEEEIFDEDDDYIIITNDNNSLTITYKS